MPDVQRARDRRRWRVHRKRIVSTNALIPFICAVFSPEGLPLFLGDLGVVFLRHLAHEDYPLRKRGADCTKDGQKCKRLGSLNPRLGVLLEGIVRGYFVQGKSTPILGGFYELYGCAIKPG